MLHCLIETGVEACLASESESLRDAYVTGSVRHRGLVYFGRMLLIVPACILNLLL